MPKLTRVDDEQRVNRYQEGFLPPHNSLEGVETTVVLGVVDANIQEKRRSGRNAGGMNRTGRNEGQGNKKK